jgi:hypothetical protein
LGGAAAGAAIGSVVPVIGTGIGALAGGVLGALSDRRTKEDIEKVGKTESGLPIYTFKYKGDPVTHMGLMSDEVRKKFPEAVIRAPDGYDRVHYGMVH